MMSQEWKKDYHQNPHILHVGTEEPRAYFIPFESEAGARGGEREESERFCSLCGSWRFRYYSSPAEMEASLATPRTEETADAITVPMSWQVRMDRGYDAPEYHDTDYPFFVDPPYVPSANPVGLYERDVEVAAEDLADRVPYLLLEGVDSCFYLYVNDTFVGYSQISHSTSEFRLDAYLHPGRNRIQVMVLKWCDGSYLEDQDKLRLSGIFREVYLLWRDPVHIRDVYLRTTVSDNFDRAVLRAEASLTGKGAVAYRLLDPQGQCIAEGTQAEADYTVWEIPVETPLLWSDEAPQLYELCLRCGREHIRLEAGIRRFEIKGRVLYVNGRAVKGKGVNRHDSHPELGAATPKEHMLRDLYIMKAHNINMVRTSHYPNDPRFLEYCDRLGLYVCNEADLEAHGMDYTEGFGRNTLSDDPDWTEAYVDRAVSLMERDKNHACVLLWSTGNESGIGRNLQHMAEYFHRRMPESIVHSERYQYIEHLLRQKEPSVEGFERYLTEPYTDIDSRMYATPEDCLENYINAPTATRPFFLCEYCHAMGNGPGDLTRYWDLIWNNDCFFGACVWEFSDHAVNAGTPEAPRYLYGGDFGEKIHEGNFCVDGLIYPDRRIRSDLLEYRQILAPCVVRAFDPQSGRLTVGSRRYFTSCSDIELFYTVADNGTVLREGLLEHLDIAPCEEAVYTLPLTNMSLSGNAYLTLYFRTVSESPWAPAHHVLSVEQIPLHTAKYLPAIQKENGPLSLSHEPGVLCVRDGDVLYRIKEAMGALFSITAEGRELLASPVSFALWRAPTDNDRIIRKEWQRMGYDRMKTDCRRVVCETNEPGRIVLRADLKIGADARPLFANLTVRYAFEPGKGVTIEHTLSLKDKPKVTLPRVGFGFAMTEGFETLRYFGLGPYDAYPDKRLASRMGLFETTVTGHFEPYLKPQENMAHADTLWMELLDKDGWGLQVHGGDETPRFSFNASHYTPMDLTNTPHVFELCPRKETVVNIDFSQAGIGSNSCGPALAEEFSLLASEYHYAYTLLPRRIRP